MRTTGAFIGGISVLKEEIVYGSGSHQLSNLYIPSNQEHRRIRKRERSEQQFEYASSQAGAPLEFFDMNI
ncbi:unnamed protein product [Auanema sp. JU1783]|nr:unnamed protein product [Auanema sp. JU1783]